MKDLSRRELAVLAPLIVLILWIGIYPAPILERVEASAEHVVAQVKAGTPPPQVPSVPVGTPIR